MLWQCDYVKFNVKTPQILVIREVTIHVNNNTVSTIIKF